MESYDIYIVQETWLNETVTNEELISNTSYDIVRNDRSTFTTNRIRGGGVMMLIHRKIKYTEIQINIPTTVEIQIVQLHQDSHNLILINVYMPPNRARRIQTNQLAQVINAVRKDFPNDDVIIAGDFNMPNVYWKMIDHSTEIANTELITPNDLRLINVLQQLGLQQRIHLPNSRGTFLDLVFTSKPIFNLNQVPIHKLIDNNSINHMILFLKRNQ